MNNGANDFFNEDFARLFMTRTPKLLQQISDFILKTLHAPPGSTIFDQCCGTGDISLKLASLGYHTIGVDIADTYAATARKRAASLQLDCQFEKGDATLYQTTSPCDGAFNWWTSFGYEDSDAGNIKMIDCAFRSLKPGCGFILDFMNSESYNDLRKADAPSIMNMEHDEGDMIWTAHIDPVTNRIFKNWEFRGHDGRTAEHKGFGVKLYTADQLAQMFTACGFTHIRQYGDIHEAPYSPYSPRCITIGFKP